MAKQTINIGTAANDSTGDPLRTAFDKTNDNFDELYTADGLKANIASPTLTGTPAAPTAGAATNSTQLATTAFVQQELSSGTTALLTSNFIDDDTMATATATTISSSESTKAYVDTLISGTDTMHYKGDYNASTNSPDLDSPTGGTVFTGDTYYVATAGTSFFSETLAIGDLLISQVDDPSTVDDWVVFQQSTELATDLSPQLAGQLDINGNSIGDGTLELLSFSETASAVNELTITNAATTGAPQLSATGDDTNIDLDLQPKGSGNVILGNYTLDGDQTVGAGTDGYVLTYDNATGNISLEAAAAGGGDALVANGLDQFAATTSAELAGVVSDETGSGALCFATSPTLVTPALGTPASGVMTNVTGTAAGLTAGNATAAVTATTATTATKSDALSTTGASVDVAAAAPPSTNQVLKATSATTATWQAEAGGTPEGTAILSTGETGGTKYLREDGDGTCSWQAVTGGSGDFLADGTVAMTGELDLGANAIGGTMQSITATTAPGTTTLDWGSGNIAKLDLNWDEVCDLNFTAPTKTGLLTLIVEQNVDFGGTITWDTTVKWPGGTAPTLTNTANSIDVIQLTYDGTNYYGTFDLNFS